MPPVERSQGLFYPAVALGLYAYAATAFRLMAVGEPGNHPEPGTLYVAAHRAETDVPAICGGMFVASRTYRRRWPRLHFAARDDLFEPGFFAGFPPDLGPRTRRALYPIGIARYLPKVQVRPIRSATSMNVAQALARIDARTELAGALPPPLLDELASRAAQLGSEPPSTVGDALTADYVDILWQPADAGLLDADVFAPVWSARAAEATADLRGLVDLLRAGEPLLLFPEGRPSPDGSVGPVQRGLGALIRRGRPDRVRAFSIGYDDLTMGRSRIYVAGAEPAVLPSRDLEPAVERYLAATLPLTVAQVVAPKLTAAAARGDSELDVGELSAALAAEVEQAAVARRPLDPVLLSAPGRVALLDECLQAAAARGALRARSRRTVGLEAAAILEDALLQRYTREHRSVQDALQQSRAA